MEFLKTLDKDELMWLTAVTNHLILVDGDSSQQKLAVVLKYFQYLDIDLEIYATQLIDAGVLRTILKTR